MQGETTPDATTNVTPDLTTVKHTRLFHQMAEALGVDLKAAVQAGHIDLEDLASSVQSCKACKGDKACQVWLNHATPGEETATPGYCNNGAFLQMQRILGKTR